MGEGNAFDNLGNYPPDWEWGSGKFFQGALSPAPAANPTSMSTPMILLCVLHFDFSVYLIPLFKTRA